MTVISRRSFLQKSPLVTAGIMIPVGSVGVALNSQPAQTPEQAVDRLAQELLQAMTALHGEGCEIVRNKYRVVSVVEPPRPLVKFTGPGWYEIRDGNGEIETTWVEHAPEYDAPDEGRMFRLKPADEAQAGSYVFEWRLQEILIRPVSWRVV